ncbi:hypothetical protein B296_00033189 [Ensete ventricosum]|uniref:Uncharacterized protein n=1 Tax=Ensete ventricosum TaxID=4639 RepID=A0A427ABL4_ENSVE|nr:hypothetical protein B296_00033189 [Ensete ventricosum]
MTAPSLLRVGRLRIALYVKGSLTTMNETITILDLGSSPTVTGRGDAEGRDEISGKSCESGSHGDKVPVK